MPSATNINNCIAMYDKLCQDICLRQNNYNENVICALLLFQKNIDHVKVYENCIPDIFVDWDHVKMLPNYSLYKDPNSWITLLHYVDCDVDDLVWKTLLSKCRICAYFAECLLSMCPGTAYTDIIKLFVLINIPNLEALTVFELYYANINNNNMRDKGLLFFSKLANEQFDKNDRTLALTYLINNVLKVRAQDIMNEVDILKANKDMFKEGMTMRTMRAIVKRPQLRSKQRTFDLVIDDSFKTWKDRIRFSNCFSIVNAKKLYFFMAQTHMDLVALLPSYVKEEDLRCTILSNIIKKPDLSTITDVILSSRICSSPFPELHTFRDKGIASFSMQQKSKLRLNDLFHLYISAYQIDWKSVWRHVVPILSSQIIHDIDDFVKEYPFNARAVLDIVFTD